ncbi:MAG: histidine kinase [Rhodoglobus sp.]|nr:histidine kinase [Rhodoglobus sp.]
MPTPADPRTEQFEIVIPDCCNIGVIFRTLLIVNASVAAAIFLRTVGFQRAALDFIEATMLIEWVCLLSLFMLCGFRRLLDISRRFSVSSRMQRSICALVPAVITAVMMRFLASFDWFMNSFPNLTMLHGVLLAALFGLVLQHYFELRTSAFSPALMEARLQALHARIRPHFLFNSLNAVLSLIRPEPLRAEAALEDLADLFRVLMRDSRDMTSLEDEIHLCKQYLSIEKIRLGDRLQIQWDTMNISDSALRKAQISALLLQPLLENAVHYGVEPAREAALIKIRISRSSDRIEVVVVNPMHGDVLVEGGNQMALKNIRERLALLYDVEAHLTARVIEGHFEVRLRFPYVKLPSAERKK